MKVTIGIDPRALECAGGPPTAREGLDGEPEFVGEILDRLAGEHALTGFTSDLRRIVPGHGRLAPHFQWPQDGGARSRRSNLPSQLGVYVRTMSPNFLPVDPLYLETLAEHLGRLEEIEKAYSEKDSEWIGMAGPQAFAENSYPAPAPSTWNGFPALCGLLGH